MAPRLAAAAAALALSACAGTGRRPVASDGEVAREGGTVGVDDSSHLVAFEVPKAKGGWQNARDGSARVGDGVQVEIASFPLARAATPAGCRDTMRARLTALRGRGDDEDNAKPSPAPAPASPPQDGPRDQEVSDDPTATWSFTRGSAKAPVRNRWAFFPRGADCVLLEVTGPAGDKFAERVFDRAARTLKVLPLPPERQREVDLLAGMRFLEQREPGNALDRFEALAAREPDFAKAHFGALMAGFDVGPPAYKRALPHGVIALKAERELSPEQRQLALRAVGVMELAEDQLRPAADTLAELVVRVPDLAEGQYNYACALARLGDAAGALDHLAAALRLDASLASHAREDEDLKSLRGRTSFEQLVREKRAGADPRPADADAAKGKSPRE